MCRWVTLLSNDDISLSDVVLAPSNSMVHQSRDATFHPGYDAINNAVLNADGFGVGWYHSNVAKLPFVHPPTTAGDGTVGSAKPIVNKILTLTDAQAKKSDYRAAALFRDVFPAWNNMNLRELCLSTSSDCIMAHVRAASPGTGISLVNCHPFKAGRLLFCHNGRVFGYQQHVKRKLLARLSDEAFGHVRGSTDSEGVFALILTHLGQDGLGSPLTQQTPFGAKRLVHCLQQTLGTLDALATECMGSNRDYSTCNFALTDGETLVVTRYCDQSPSIPPPSLYYAFGSSLREELTSDEAATPQIFSNGRIQEEAEDESDSDLDDLEEEDASADTDSSHEDSETLLVRRHRIPLLQQHESKPGKVFAAVDPATATFCVSSNPLTRTHCWHKVPKNSIMWCTRGKHPELRLLHHKTKKQIQL